jgi:hypothetical protein
MQPIQSSPRNVSQPAETQAAAGKSVTRPLPPSAAATTEEQPVASAASNRAIAASPIRQVPPVVPSSFKSLLMRDTIVKVKLALDPEGKVISAQAAAETPPVLRYISEDAARRWRFRPATLDGKPVSSEYFINFTFKR